MSKKLELRGTDDLARRWHALAERRREHFADLHDSGRWRKYYHEHNFLHQMHATAQMTDAWTNVVNGVPPAIARGAAHSAAAFRRV